MSDAFAYFNTDNSHDIRADNTCDASGTRCHISVRREGDAGVPDLLADCKDVDLTVLHNYVVQSLQASRVATSLNHPTSNPRHRHFAINAPSPTATLPFSSSIRASLAATSRSTRST